MADPMPLRGFRSDHSGRPPFRSPTANLARSSGRRSGIKSSILEIRNDGLSLHRASIAFWAVFNFGARVLLAAGGTNASRKSGRSRARFGVSLCPTQALLQEFELYHPSLPRQRIE